jgi:hypothetical protein
MRATVIKNLLILIILVFSGWQLYLSVPQKIINVTAENKVRSDQGFEISIPKGWVIGDNKSVNVAALLIDPKSTSNNAPTNINIVVESTNQGLDDYVVNNVKTLQEKIKTYTLLKNERATIGGIPAILLTGSLKNNDQLLEYKQLIAIDAKRAFIVTGTSPTTQWATAEPVIMDAIGSFAIQRK